MTIALDGAHPLFPNDDEDKHDDGDPIQVSSIQITRMENGQAVYAPRVRPASELISLDQIAAELGGGVYILIARHEGRITTRRKYVIPGKPKPMYDEIETPKEAPSATVPITPAQGLSGIEAILPLMMTMMQGMMQSQAQAAQNQTQMFIAMMTSNQQNSAEEKAAARAQLQADIERERQSSERTLAMMREMMSAKGGGAGEDFTRGVEFMRSFATQQIDSLRAAAKGDGETDWGGMLETLGQVMQGVGMFKGMVSAPNGAGEVAAAASEVVQ